MLVCVGMTSIYGNTTLMQSAIIDVAAELSGSRLNPLVLMSDPERTPDLLALAARLPSNSALIYRHFGTPGLETELRRITQNHGVQLLIGHDPELAEACGADGVHFSRRTKGSTLSEWRLARPDWIISSAAWKTGTDPRPLGTLDAVFVSPVFTSHSPSAGTPMGADALKEVIRTLPCPVFALGGINERTAPQLRDTGVAGIAAVDGLAKVLRTHPMNMTNQTVSISKSEDDQRIIFTATVKGRPETGELTLRRVADNVWNANHTGVPKAIGGRGVGKALVAAMVEDARQLGYRVIPGCSFVARLFERKPEWADGVAA
ncbi:MAG: N-acetyltransferase [Pseudomonadota bacterium]